MLQSLVNFFKKEQFPLKANVYRLDRKFFLFHCYEFILHGFLQGATIVDQTVTIELARDYKPPATASATPVMS